MKGDFTTNSHYLVYTFLFRKVGRMHFLNLGVKGLIQTKGHVAALVRFNEPKNNPLSVLKLQIPCSSGRRRCRWRLRRVKRVHELRAAMESRAEAAHLQRGELRQWRVPGLQSKLPRPPRALHVSRRKSHVAGNWGEDTSVEAFTSCPCCKANPSPTHQPHPPSVTAWFFFAVVNSRTPLFRSPTGHNFEIIAGFRNNRVC